MFDGMTMLVPEQRRRHWREDARGRMGSDVDGVARTNGVDGDAEGIGDAQSSLPQGMVAGLAVHDEAADPGRREYGLEPSEMVRMRM